MIQQYLKALDEMREIKSFEFENTNFDLIYFCSWFSEGEEAAEMTIEGDEDGKEEESEESEEDSESDNLSSEEEEEKYLK